jgi:hypothetical protein
MERLSIKNPETSIGARFREFSNNYKDVKIQKLLAN